MDAHQRSVTRLALDPDLGDFRLRVLDGPAGRRDLCDFRCGDDSLRRWVGRHDGPRVALRPRQQSVIEVHAIAANLFTGRSEPQVVIGLELLGTLVGFVGIRRRPYTGRYPIEPAGHYINVIARSEEFTGFRPEPRRTSCSVLLRAALEQIAAWEERMPAVWALAWPDNEPSRRLFAEHGFQAFVPSDIHRQSLLLRPSGIGLERGALTLERPAPEPPDPS